MTGRLRIVLGFALAVLLLLPTIGYAIAVVLNPALAQTAWSLLTFSAVLAPIPIAWASL